MNKKIFTIIFTTLLTFGLCFSISTSVHAFEIGAGQFKTNISDPDVPYKDLDTSVSTIVNIAITVSEVAFIILFLVGGVMYLTSMGNEEQAGRARKLLIDSVIGLVIVLATWAVSTWIIKQLTDPDTTSSSVIGGAESGTQTGANAGADIGTNTNTEDMGTATTVTNCLNNCQTTYTQSYSSCSSGTSGNNCRTQAATDFKSCQQNCI